MGRKRKYPLEDSLIEGTDMKVVLTGVAACPQGVAKPGTVMEMREEDAKDLIARHHAREYNAERDRKSPHGYARPPETFAQ